MLWLIVLSLLFIVSCVALIHRQRSYLILCTEHRCLLQAYEEKQVLLNQNSEAIKQLTQENQKLSHQLVTSQVTEKMQDAHHKAAIDELTAVKASMKQEFQCLASQIFDDKVDRFKNTNTEMMTHLLTPLKEQIRHFEQKIQQTHDKSTQEQHHLSHELKTLRALNQQLSHDAKNLTDALKSDTKKQGLWGEFVLEKILELSGLVAGREFKTQTACTTSHGKNQFPDAIVHLPEDRDIVIDAKVSLTAYEQFIHCDETEKAHYLQQHIQSLQRHIKTLSARNYQNLDAVKSLDFVLLFMPIESAFSAALQAETALYQQAFDHNIIIVTPSTLLACLRTIQNFWRSQHQTHHAQQIAQKAGELFDKFVSFSNDLLDVGKRLDQTQKHYAQAMNKLTQGRGNLVKRCEQLRAMGANTTKRLDNSLTATHLDSIDCEE